MNQNTRQPPVSPLLAIALGILAVSTASIFIRFAQAEAPSLVIAAYRLTIASVILAPLALITRRHELAGLHKKDFSLALLSGFFLAIHFATWISSLAYTTVASSAVLVSTTPLFVAILSPIFLKEQINRHVAVGLFLALIGGTIVALSDTCTWQQMQLNCHSWSQFADNQALKGNLLALAGAAAGACYVMIGRRLRAKVSLLSYIFVVYGMAAIVLVIVMLASGASPFGYSPLIYLWFVLLALVPQLIGHTTFNWALGYLSAAFVAITLLGEPIGTTVLAYLILDEIPNLTKIVGAALIFMGIVIASRSNQIEVEQQAALE